MAQGSLISPLLFNLYMNDLLLRIGELKGVEIRAYADDLVVLTEELGLLEHSLEIIG